MCSHIHKLFFENLLKMLKIALSHNSIRSGKIDKYINICVCVYVCVCVYICIHIYVCVYIYVFIYIYKTFIRIWDVLQTGMKIIPEKQNLLAPVISGKYVRVEGVSFAILFYKLYPYVSFHLSFSSCPSFILSF